MNTFFERQGTAAHHILKTVDDETQNMTNIEHKFVETCIQDHREMSSPNIARLCVIMYRNTRHRKKNSA